MKKGFYLLAAILSGCGGAKQSPNLPMSVQAPSVREYSANELAMLGSDATPLGLVNARHCQQTPNSAPPVKAELVRALKFQARELGANGLLVAFCETTKTAACTSKMVCRGTAYSVAYREERYP